MINLVPLLIIITIGWRLWQSFIQVVGMTMKQRAESLVQWSFHALVEEPCQEHETSIGIVIPNRVEMKVMKVGMKIQVDTPEQSNMRIPSLDHWTWHIVYNQQVARAMRLDAPKKSAYHLHITSFEQNSSTKLSLGIAVFVIGSRIFHQAFCVFLSFWLSWK